MQTPRLCASLCLLGGLLPGTPAPGQQELRSVILSPPTARKSGAPRPPRHGSTQGYEIRDFDIEARLFGGFWVNLQTVTGNTSTFNSYPFGMTSTTGLRVRGRGGPLHPPGYMSLS